MQKREEKIFRKPLNKISDYKSFSKIIQPFCSKKQKIRIKVTLVNHRKYTILEDHLVLEELNNFFENATKSLQSFHLENSYIMET